MLEIDLHYLGVPRAICCFADLDEGWLVDPGPESAHANLLQALPEDWAPRRILLTHIHFDHAGATGRLLERWPDTEVWVHERGARHLADPQRLVASARRIYGDDFDRLWGAVVPVPEPRLRALSGGEARDGWRVAYTPGHASHHVSYLHEATGAALTGDVAGVRIGDGPVLAPSPPPDIDRELWLASVQTLRAWSPSALCVTHFGTWTDVEDQLQAVADGVVRWSELARETDEAAYGERVRRYVEAHTDDPGARASYEQANPAGTLWSGWARYWAKREQAAA
jgi:glyoxylase-like metal-dependent hydrolase (beta-lactamase superfamily II)